MKLSEFHRTKKASELAVERIIAKGSDDVFRPPIFPESIERTIISSKTEEFRIEAKKRAIRFLRSANLTSCKIGFARKFLIIKDESSFRQVAWLDPFDSVNFLAACLMIYDDLESARISKSDSIIHSHGKSDSPDEIF